MNSISVIIPAWDEEGGIRQTIGGIPRSELQKMGYQLQILVVDGVSKDATVEMAQNAGAEVIIEPRRGYGRAYKTGFANAKGDIIVTADADGSYPMQDIPKLVKILEDKKLDFITTNRIAHLTKGAMPLRNRIGNVVLGAETRILYGLKMKDPESGMWIFKRDILNRLKIETDNNTFSHEIKLEACFFARCAWEEIPISYISRSGGSSKLTYGWSGWKSGFGNFVHICKKRIIR